MAGRIAGPAKLRHPLQEIRQLPSSKFMLVCTVYCLQIPYVVHRLSGSFGKKLWTWAYC